MREPRWGMRSPHAVERTFHMGMLACIARPATDTLSGRHDMGVNWSKSQTVGISETGWMVTLEFTVNKWIVSDEAGFVWGRYDTRDEAIKAMK